MHDTMMCWKAYFWNGVVGYDGRRTWTTNYVESTFPRQLNVVNQPGYDSNLFTYNQTVLADLLQKYDVSPPGTEVRGKKREWGSGV